MQQDKLQNISSFVGRLLSVHKFKQYNDLYLTIFSQ